MPVSNLLIDKRPLVVGPRLAVIIGLPGAVLLQQVQYWIAHYEDDAKPEERERHMHDGHCWIYNTYAEWQKQFPFWSTRTIQRIIDDLEGRGVLISGKFSQSNIDQTKWYRIDHEALNALAENGDADAEAEKGTVDEPSPNTTSCRTGYDNLSSRLRQVDDMYIGTETTAETTTKITNTAKQTTAGPLGDVIEQKRQKIKPPSAVRPRDPEQQRLTKSGPIKITREWQRKASEIETKLKTHHRHRTSILKACRDMPAPVIDAALTYTVDYPNADNPALVFLKAAHRLSKEYCQAKV